MGQLLSLLLDTFFSKKLDIVVVGLDNAGKTTLLKVLAKDKDIETIPAPTIGMNIKEMKHENVKMQVWDLGGQVRFRDDWFRYAMACNVIIFVVDCSDRARLPEAKKELHRLLEKKELNGLPLLVVGNKIDVEGHIEKQELISGLNLDYITQNTVAIAEISALKQTNVEEVVRWMVDHAPS